jgi:hypothetical protein
MRGERHRFRRLAVGFRTPVRVEIQLVDEAFVAV